MFHIFFGFAILLAAVINCSWQGFIVVFILLMSSRPGNCKLKVSDAKEIKRIMIKLLCLIYFFQCYFKIGNLNVEAEGFIDAFVVGGSFQHR